MTVSGATGWSWPAESRLARAWRRSLEPNTTGSGPGARSSRSSSASTVASDLAATSTRSPWAKASHAMAAMECDFPVPRRARQERDGPDPAGRDRLALHWGQQIGRLDRTRGRVGPDRGGHQVEVQRVEGRRPVQIPLGPGPQRAGPAGLPHFVNGEHTDARHDRQALTAHESVGAVGCRHQLAGGNSGRGGHRGGEVPEPIEAGQQCRRHLRSLADQGAAAVFDGVLELMAQWGVGDQFGDFGIARGNQPRGSQAAADPDRGGDERVEDPSGPPVGCRGPPGHEEPADPQRPLPGPELVDRGQPLTEVAFDRHGHDVRARGIQRKPKCRALEPPLQEVVMRQEQAQRRDG